ncbi:YncE family protein [Nocardia sp. CA2R105]|uniref:YncE family protein n=1 Tax=Nocardia coffeae TaxID=2873381 RepID=UPI001CA5F623|nr:YncE family protein [Nocardia coffeae]MBY8856383.1 YncE family protein [Nocardia coffeae]
MSFTTRLLGGIGLAAVVIATSSCSSPTTATTPATTSAPTTSDPAENPDFAQLGAGPYRSRGTVGVGTGPVAVTVDPGLHQAYTANMDHTVSVVDTRSRTLTATVPLGDVFVHNPRSIAVDPATHLVYFADEGPVGDVSVIDPATNTVTARIPLGDGHSAAVTVDSERHTLYVANTNRRKVTAIDTRTRAVVATIALTNGPTALAVDPGNHQLWAAGTGTLSVVDPATFAVSTTIPVSGDTDAMAIDPGTHTAYITHLFGHSVSFVDTTTHAVGSISLGNEGSYGVAIDPDTHTALLTSLSFESITMIDTRTHTVSASRVTEKSSAGTHSSWGIAVDTTTHDVYVTYGEYERGMEVLTRT